MQLGHKITFKDIKVFKFINYNYQDIIKKQDNPNYTSILFFYRILFIHLRHCMEKHTRIFQAKGV